LKLKDMYDGKYKAKIIKGLEDAEMKHNLDGIIVNFMGVGTKKGITSESHKDLMRIASSGLYRRAYIIDSKQMVEKMNLKQILNH